MSQTAVLQKWLARYSSRWNIQRQVEYQGLQIWTSLESPADSKKEGSFICAQGNEATVAEHCIFHDDFRAIVKAADGFHWINEAPEGQPPKVAP